MASDLARAALWYARNGWRVFPCLPRDKMPAIKAWQKLATTEARQVETWWRSRPESNIGIACGAESGVYVIDVDTKEGKDGEADLMALCDELGDLPDTICQRTGSGGRQYFFQMPAGTFKNSRGKVAPSIDTRSNGGFVVVPPSVHPCGDAYRWIYGPHELEPAPLPEPWRRRLEYREPPRIAVPVRRYDAMAPMAAEMINRRAQAIGRAQKGTRNDALYRSAFMLAKRAGEGLISWAEASDALFHAALAAGLDRREATATIRSAEKGAASCR